MNLGIQVIPAGEQKGVSEAILAVNQIANAKAAYGENSIETELAVRELKRVYNDNLRDAKFKSDQQLAKLTNELRTERAQNRLKQRAIAAYESGDMEQFDILQSILTGTARPADIQALTVFEGKEFASKEEEVTTRELLGGASRTDLDEIRIAEEEGLLDETGAKVAAQREFHDLTDEEKNAALLQYFVEENIISEEEAEEALLDILTKSRQEKLDMTENEKAQDDLESIADDGIKKATILTELRMKGAEGAKKRFTASIASDMKAGKRTDALLKIADQLEISDPSKEAQYRYQTARKLVDLSDDFQALADAGIDTDEWLQLSLEIMSDTELNIQKWIKDQAAKLKNLTNDQKVLLGKVMTKSGRFLASYIKAISGTAASDSEAGRLARLLPSLGRDSQLNIGSFVGNFEDLVVGQSAFYNGILHDDGLVGEIMDAKGWRDIKDHIKVMQTNVLPEGITNQQVVEAMKRSGKTRQEVIEAFRQRMEAQ